MLSQNSISMAPSQSTRPPSSKSLDLEITIVSAKHLKNVNWRNGALKPYAVFWLDPDWRLVTKADNSGSIHPVWNERFTLPINLNLDDSVLTVEIFHSRPSETPKPLIGSLRLSLKDLDDADDSNRIRKFELRRPSGRPHGKLCVKLGIRERPGPAYHHGMPPPPPSYYYSSTPPSHFPPVREHRGYSPSPYSSIPPPLPLSPPPVAVPLPSQPPFQQYGTYSESSYSFYPNSSSFYQPPPPPRTFYDRQPSYGGPSAPVDYSQYDQKPKGSKIGLGTGLAVGAVAGALGGLALEETLNYEEDKVSERIENDITARDDYSDYRGNY